MENNVLAVWGAPDSGKTTLSVKIARELQARRRSVVLVLCNDETPALPLLLPNSRAEHRSLGELLSKPRISQAEILRYSVPFAANDNISLLGYCVDDNPTTYPEYSALAAKNLLNSLSRLADAIIIDCSSSLTGSQLTPVAMEVADVTLRVVEADIKSTIFLRSAQPYLIDAKYRYGHQSVVLNNVRTDQDANAHAAIDGAVKYILPHSDAVAEQLQTGKLSDGLFGRDAKHYDPVIKQIVKDVFGE